ncbi:MAG: type IX secretion system membrane protein PorP/SprF [Bacteroidia bacterium]
MRKKLLIACCLFFAFGELKAQDVMFSQFYANPLYLNPAFAGSGVGPRFNLNYRNQWPSLPGNYVTYAASYDQYFSAISGGIGVQVLSDRIGDPTFAHNQVAIMYSNNLNITNNLVLKTGFQYMFAQRSLNWLGLIFPDEIDARLGVQPGTTLENIPGQAFTNANMHDFSAGALLFSENFYGGFAFHHLTQPNQSLIPPGVVPWQLRTTIHAGANIEVVRGSRNMPATTLSPNIITVFQGAATQFNFGTYITRGPIVGGLWYRLNDAVIVSLGLQQGVFRMGYSYDITTSGLRQAALGSHEISFALQLESKERIPRRKMVKIKCPTF